MPSEVVYQISALSGSILDQHSYRDKRTTPISKRQKENSKASTKSNKYLQPTPSLCMPESKKKAQKKHPKNA
jgi:hypothetical protein